MWFIFPQLQGLGSSHTARLYAIASVEEARAYLAHAVLGERLRRVHEAGESNSRGAASRRSSATRPPQSSARA